ncbi:hypothetical protein EV291_108136 [Rhizobium sp. BK068]|nr:hypothetical protein EV291_108136 [Rhizobium sp. BK068]
MERANQTLQDRLIKEMRLRGIDTIEAANAYAPEFIVDFNSRFGKPPRNPKDMHRPLAEHENLDGAMCRKEVRTLSQSLTLRYDKVLLVIERLKAYCSPEQIASRLLADGVYSQIGLNEHRQIVPWRAAGTALMCLNKLNFAHEKPRARPQEALAAIFPASERRRYDRDGIGSRRGVEEDDICGVADRNAVALAS